LKLEGLAGLAIKKICSGVKGFNPIRTRHGCLFKKSLKNIIDNTNATFGLPILRGCIEARETEGDTMS
jgi:hypothetical protein